MIRLRGVPISDEQALELARRLRESAGSATGLAERLGRALEAGGGLVATGKADARLLLAVLDPWVADADEPGALLEVRDTLCELLAVRAE